MKIIKPTAVFRILFVCFFLFNSWLVAGKGSVFTENRGQWDNDVLYRCNLPNGSLYITNHSLVYYLYEIPVQHPFSTNSLDLSLSKQVQKGITDPAFQGKIPCHVYVVSFPGGNSKFSVIGKGVLSYPSNYLIGNDSKKWGIGCKSYTGLILKDIYMGVDLELFSHDGKTIKYNFHVTAGFPLNRLLMLYSGSEKLDLKNEKLKIYTSVGIQEEDIPHSYLANTHKAIQVKYRLHGDTVGFSFSSQQYNENIVIDPRLVFSTFSGSSADNWGYTATYDVNGNGYTAGIVYGDGFPEKNATQIGFGGGYNVPNDMIGDLARDIGILKFAPDGQSIIYATYVGGSHNEQPHSMVVNSKGELCVLGTTASSNFPGITSNSYQKTMAGVTDIILFKIPSGGNTITGASYIGGTGRDGLNGELNANDQNISQLGWNYGDIYRGEINCDNFDNIFIASSTESANQSGLPLKNSEWGSFGGGTQDGYVACINSAMTSLNWSTYIGGSGNDAAYGIYIYNSTLYVCGGTDKSDLRLKNTGTNPFQDFYQGGRCDGFIFRFNALNGKVESSSFLGTEGYDQAFFVQADRYGAPYIYGQCNSGKWPVSTDIYNNPGSGQFIIKLSSDLSHVERSTVFGSGRNNPDISPSAFLVDRCGRIFVAGWGGRVNSFPRGNGGNTAKMPVSKNAFDTLTDGSDFYLAVFNRELDTLIYGTFFGGDVKNRLGEPLAEHVDGGTSRFDYEGRVYQAVCAGCGGFDEFPTTPNAYSRVNGSVNCNNAIFKIDFENLNFKPTGENKNVVIYASDTINIPFTGVDKDNHDSVYIECTGTIFGAPFSPPFAIRPDTGGIGTVHSRLYWTPGCQHASKDTYTVVIRIRDNNQCPTPDTSFSFIKITVKEPPLSKPPQVVCVAHFAEKTTLVSWEKTDTSKYHHYYLLLRRDPKGKIVILDTIYKSGVGEYYDNNAPGHEYNNYCYYMIGVNICGKRGDSSYLACSADEFRDPIDSVYLYTATVNDNKEVEFSWFSSHEPDFFNYMVFKSTRILDTTIVFRYYASIYNQYDTIFIDTLTSVQDSSYCYKIKVADKCGHISPYSNEGCTILLRGESGVFLNNLNWNRYRSWKGRVGEYQIWRMGNTVSGYNYIDRTLSSVFFFQDTSLDYNQGKFTYKVVGIEDIKGYGAKSESNYITLIQPPLLWVPEAFTPNLDGINDVWKWIPVFVKDIHITLYTRWGEKIFETENKENFWNGIYNDREYDNNVYIWHITYTGWDGSIHTQKGTLTVLK